MKKMILLLVLSIMLMSCDIGGPVKQEYKEPEKTEPPPKQSVEIPFEFRHEVIESPETYLWIIDVYATQGYTESGNKDFEVRVFVKGHLTKYGATISLNPFKDYKDTLVYTHLMFKRIGTGIVGTWDNFPEELRGTFYDPEDVTCVIIKK